MSPATVHHLDEVRRLALSATAPADVRTLAQALVDHGETLDERADEAATHRDRIERKVDGLLVHARDQAARITAVAEQLAERIDGAEVHAMRARGDARRAEEAADRAMHLSDADVARIAEAVRPVVQAPIVKAGRQGIARGVGGALAAGSLLVAGGFAKDPEGFVSAVDSLLKIFGGG
jgi:hypothetical protein